jgi:hypothetical protein
MFYFAKHWASVPLDLQKKAIIRGMPPAQIQEKQERNLGSNTTTPRRTRLKNPLPEFHFSMYASVMIPDRAERCEA